MLVQGQGLLLVSSFGAIQRKGYRLASDMWLILDIWWPGKARHSTLCKAAAGSFRSMMSGEGIVAGLLVPGNC